MEKITLHKENSYSTTTISNRFIDEYMTSANGEFVKIYLYLLRCMNSPDCSFSISKAADKFNHTEKDIQRALKYWEKMNLLQLEYAQDKSIAGIYFLDSEDVLPKDDSVPLKKAPSPGSLPEAAAFHPLPKGHAAQTASSHSAERKSYSTDELKSFQEKEEIQELMFVAESYLKKPLSSTDIQTLLFWYDGLGLSADLIVYLLEYCIAGGHASLHYMDKVAASWKEKDITTVEQAKQNVQAHSRLHYAVLKSLGIQGRSLVPAEFSYIEKWNKEYGFSEDMIAEACSRTILAIHQPSFEYADRILLNWKRQNIGSAEDIRKADESFQAAKTAERAHTATFRNNAAKPAAHNRFNSFPQRTYNMDQLEVELLNTAR